jgi:hypothetical protein
MIDQELIFMELRCIDQIINKINIVHCFYNFNLAKLVYRNQKPVDALRYE